jgi:hypothetical protein
MALISQNKLALEPYCSFLLVGDVYYAMKGYANKPYTPKQDGMNNFRLGNTTSHAMFICF